MRTAPGGELKESEIPHWGNRLGQRRNIWGWWDSEATDLWLSEWNANHTDNPCCSHMYPEQGCCVTSFSGSVNPNFCDPMDCSTPCFPIHHQLPELAQTHQVHQVRDVIQPSHPLLSPSTPAFNLSQHQVLFQWVSSSHQVAKVLEFQLQHQSFQWIFRTDFL